MTQQSLLHNNVAYPQKHTGGEIRKYLYFFVHVFA